MDSSGCVGIMWRYGGADYEKASVIQKGSGKGLQDITGIFWFIRIWGLGFRVFS